MILNPMVLAPMIFSSHSFGSTAHNTVGDALIDPVDRPRLTPVSEALAGDHILRAPRAGAEQPRLNSSADVNTSEATLTPFDEGRE